MSGGNRRDRPVLQNVSVSRSPNDSIGMTLYSVVRYRRQVLDAPPFSHRLSLPCMSIALPLCFVGALALGGTLLRGRGSRTIETDEASRFNELYHSFQDMKKPA